MSLLAWRGPTNALILAPNSPKFQYTDRVRITDIYMGPQWLCVANMLARGTFGTGFRSGWVVNQCTTDTQRGTIGTLTIEWEAGGAYATQPLPIGNFSLKPQELYPKIERAACFSGITFKTLNIAHNAIDLATNSTGVPLVTDTFLTDNISDPTQLSLAQNLVAKWQKGEETFYLAGWRYTYEVYSYTAPTVNRGGVPGTPGGPLSAVLPTGVSWLRLADDLDPAGVAGSMYKLNVCWLGGPVYSGTGYWDSDVYV